MEASVGQALVAIVGSVLILTWPILVMLVRAVREAGQWRTRTAARAWIGAWFAGSGIWVVAAWIVVIIGIRLVTSTVFAGSENEGLVSWLLIVSAMVLVVPFAWRTPREPEA